MPRQYNSTQTEYSEEVVTYGGDVYHSQTKEASLSLSTSCIISVSKEITNANFGMAVQKTRGITGVANAVISLSAGNKKASVIGEKIATIILLSKTNKLSHSIKIVTLPLLTSYHRMFIRVKQIGITLSLAKLKFLIRLSSATMQLTGSGRKEVEGSANVGINLSVDNKKQGQYASNVTIPLTVSIEIAKVAVENLNAGFVLVDQKAVKKVGKMFTIREHTPSVWHNC